MPYNERSVSGSGDTAAYSMPITRAFALTILLAGLLLWALRHFYGTVTVEAGSR